MLTDFSPYLIKPKFHFTLNQYILYGSYRNSGLGGPPDYDVLLPGKFTFSVCDAHVIILNFSAGKLSI